MTFLVRLSTGYNDWRWMSHSFGYTMSALFFIPQCLFHLVTCVNWVKQESGEKIVKRWVNGQMNKGKGNYFWCSEWWEQISGVLRGDQQAPKWNINQNTPTSAESGASKGHPGRVRKLWIFVTAVNVSPLCLCSSNNSSCVHAWKKGLADFSPFS